MTGESPTPVPAQPRKWVPRFRIFHLMLLPVLLVVVLIWLDSRALLPTYAWSGQRTIALDFDVVDSLSGQPLEAVVIEVVAPSGKPRASGRTDPDGRASLVGKFDAAGTASLFGKKNNAKILPFQYSLTMPGYNSVQSVNTTGYYLGSKPPHPRFRWSLTRIDGR